MIIELQEGPQAANIDLQNWKTAFHGVILDERGKTAVDAIQQRTHNTYQLNYHPETFELELDAERFNIDEFPKVLHAKVNYPLVLEATTLGFVEILLCCRILCEKGLKRLDIVYVEPERYHKPLRSHLFTQERL